MKRVVVLGPPGAGKTSLCRRVAQQTGLPHIELDLLRFDDHGEYLPSDEWRSITADLVAEDEWILDGVYIATLEQRLERADTVIVLDLGRWLCLRRWLWRELRNRDRWIKRRWSGILTVWKWSDVMMPRLWKRIEPFRCRVSVVHLKSDRQIDEFIATTSR